MKKVIFLLIGLFALSASAQSLADIEASAERVAKLVQLVKKTPKATNIPDVDAYVTASAAAATLAISNSETINTLYKQKQDGETVDASAVAALVMNVKNEGEMVKQTTELAKPAMEAIKSERNPMKLKNLKSAVDFASKCQQLLTEETVAQANIVASLAK